MIADISATTIRFILLGLSLTLISLVVGNWIARRRAERATLKTLEAVEHLTLDIETYARESRHATRELAAAIRFLLTTLRPDLARQLDRELAGARRPRNEWEDHEQQAPQEKEGGDRGLDF